MAFKAIKMKALAPFLAKYELFGENAIAAFSFAGLTFPGGEMPARLICRPYFCRWKVTGLCLPVLKCH